MSNHRTRRRCRLRRWGLLVIDGLMVLVALALASAARYDGAIEQINGPDLIAAASLSVTVYAVFSAALRLHQGRYPIGSADELGSMGIAVTGAFVVLLAAIIVHGSPHLVPLTVAPLAGVLALALMLGIRLFIRRQRETAARPATGRRSLVFGAGIAGHQLIRSMLGHAEGAYLPVGLLDDDPAKRHVRVSGVRMLGGRDDIALAAELTDAEVLIIALPSADAELIRELSRRAAEVGLEMKVLPPMSELLGERVGIRDVRDIDMGDLLGRRQIETNVDAIAGYLVGQRVLVTGAGGSIGSELCAQIARYKPAELIMLDRDESALHSVQLSLHGEARLDLPEVVLADIRDAGAMDEIFAQRRPHVVFHAAALKHVNMLEQYPDEGWKTNVIGTRNVLEAAVSVGVNRFINVSTDKAAEPVNVLGRTKRLAEQLTATFAQRTGAAYISVRFGNVLGSRGSVLSTFAAQIARGGPVTVTHPEVTRYFMTIPEAVQLVIQAGAIGNGGEALVLDMGEPVRIADVARQLIDLAGREIEIVYTGLRPGEKLHEELFSEGEVGTRPAHPLISHVGVPPVADWVLSHGRPSARSPQAFPFLVSGQAR
jgi:FlaA1/EpsC-like NDP-sugar epimerase